MPDVDPEKGQGFEDDIFTANCFAQFPDEAFIFPEGCVIDKSFHYNGPGRCPSTWSREKVYDWDYMRAHTKSEVRMIENLNRGEELPEPVEEGTIDVVIPYVNSSDRYWGADYVKATHQHIPSAVRFRSWGTLKFLFRGIDKYMPFVRNIVLLLARPSQLPVWVNTDKVRVVYHEEFIPKQLLPTFNSCTIESFLWNIPDLADRIIYFNDDMFPVGPMDESTFFTGDKPNLKFVGPEEYSSKFMFRSQCRAGMNLITSALNLPPFEAGKIIRPYHITTSITKESLNKVRELCGDMLPDTTSVLRQAKNVNQYVYSYYQYFAGEYENKVVNYKYFEMGDKTIQAITDEILKGEYQMLCLNDSDKMKDYNRVKYRLTQAFEKKFPNKCKYEL
jgi:hypothetical protein